MTIEVIQADRDAAADLIDAYWRGHGGSCRSMHKLAQSYRDGHTGGVWAEAFARHRLSTQSPDHIANAGKMVGEQSRDALPEEYMTVTLSRDGTVTSHNDFDADFDEMVLATQTIVDALQKRLSDRKYCPYSHGGKLRKGSVPVAVSNQPSALTAAPPVSSSLVEALDEMEAATRDYFNSYLLDEAADVECCVDEKQHLAAVRLSEVLADLSLVRAACERGKAG